MTRIFRYRPLLPVLVAAVAVLLAAPPRAETLDSSNVDSRVLIGFKAAPDAVQALMPAGWTSVPFPGGPLAGTNFLVVLIDRAIALEPDGKPSSPANMRAVALAGLGKQADGAEVRLYLFRIYTTDPDRNPYGVAAAAAIGHDTATGGPANEGRDRSESWTIAPTDGGEMSVALTFASGRRGWVTDESRPHSAANPDFYRIYRYDQLVDLVTSVPAGKPLAGDFAFSSSIPELAAVFDGTQETVAIMDVPVYVRKVWLP